MAGFKPVVIQCETFNDVFFKPLGCPNTELSALGRFYAVADENNDIKIVMFNVSFHIPTAFQLNCSEFPNSCPGIQFPFFKNIFYMLTDIGF